MKDSYLYLYNGITSHVVRKDRIAQERQEFPGEIVKDPDFTDLDLSLDMDEELTYPGTIELDYSSIPDDEGGHQQPKARPLDLDGIL